MNGWCQYTFPRLFIPVRGLTPVGSSRGKSILIFAGGSRSTHWDMRIRRCEALNEQANRFWHTGNGYAMNRRCDWRKSPIDATFAERVFLCNSGAEANEAALKLARKYAHDRVGNHKSGIVAFKTRSHGRTLFTVSAGGQPTSQDFAPLPPDIRHAAYNDLNFPPAR